MKRLAITLFCALYAVAVIAAEAPELDSSLTLPIQPEEVLGLDAELPFAQEAEGEAEEDTPPWQPRPNEPSIAEVPEGANIESTADAGADYLALIAEADEVDAAALETFLERWPHHVTARLMLARLHLSNGSPERAREELGVLEENQPDVAFWQATAALQAGSVAEARVWLGRAQAQKPDDPAVWVQQAVLEQMSDNDAGAVELLRIAVSLDDSYAPAFLNLAYSFERLNKPRQALAAYRRFMTSTQRSSMRGVVMRRIAQLAPLVRELEVSHSRASR